MTIESSRRLLLVGRIVALGSEFDSFERTIEELFRWCCCYFLFVLLIAWWWFWNVLRRFTPPWPTKDCILFVFSMIGLLFDELSAMTL